MTVEITTREQLIWQRRAARVLGELLELAAHEGLPVVKWTVEDAGAQLTARCLNRDQAQRRADFETWCAVIGATARPEHSGGGRTLLYAAAKDYGGQVLTVAVLAELYDDDDDERPPLPRDGQRAIAADVAYGGARHGEPDDLVDGWTTNPTRPAAYLRVVAGAVWSLAWQFEASAGNAWYLTAPNGGNPIRVLADGFDLAFDDRRAAMLKANDLIATLRQGAELRGTHDYDQGTEGGA